jgi:hypothetical protein
MRFRVFTLLFGVTIFVLTAVGSATGQDYSAGYAMNSPSNVFDHFQNVSVHEGNLTIGDNTTFLIENCQFNLTGRLIIKDSAEVVIRNATFISNWNTSEVPEKSGSQPWRTRHIIVENQAKLTVLNSELILSAAYPWRTEYHSLLLYDHVTANITKSKVTYVNGGGDFIYTYNDSRLWIKDVTMSTHKPENVYGYEYPKSGLVTSGRSEAEVQNSTIDGVHADGNCTINFSNSYVELIETTHDSSRVNITGSTISQLEINSLDSKFWLTNTSIEQLVVRPNSKVWLNNSSVKKIVGEDRVWVVWDWPLFGQVSIPYTWTPYIVPIVVILLASTLIATIALLFLRSRKRRMETTKDINLGIS